VIRLELDRSRPPAGTVVILNSGPDAVRLWRTGNSWGDEVLSFDVMRDGLTARVVRRPQVYTRNVPSSVSVPPGGSHELPFDLGDGSWDSDEPLDSFAGVGARLVAVYEVPETPEAAVHGVWTGRVQSEPVALEAS
jgi:hypothetical protein